MKAPPRTSPSRARPPRRGDARADASRVRGKGNNTRVRLGVFVGSEKHFVVKTQPVPLYGLNTLAPSARALLRVQNPRDDRAVQRCGVDGPRGSGGDALREQIVDGDRPSAGGPLGAPATRCNRGFKNARSSSVW